MAATTQILKRFHREGTVYILERNSNIRRIEFRKKNFEAILKSWQDHGWQSEVDIASELENDGYRMLK